MTKSDPIKLKISLREKKLLLLQSPQYQTSDINLAISNYEEAINTEDWELIRHKLTTEEAKSWQAIRNIILDTYSSEYHLANLIVGEDIEYVPRKAQSYWDLGYRGDYPAMLPFDTLEIPEYECWIKIPFPPIHKIDIPTAVIIPSSYDDINTRRLQIQNVFNKFSVRDWDYGDKVTSFAAHDIGSDYHQCHLKQVLPALGTHENVWGPSSTDISSLSTQERKLVVLESHASYHHINLGNGGYFATDFHKIKTPLAQLTGCMVCGWKPEDITTKCVVDPPYNPSDYFGYAILVNPNLRLACLGYLHWAFSINPASHNSYPCIQVPHTEDCIIDDDSPYVCWVGILDIIPKLAEGKSFAEAMKEKEVMHEHIFHGDPTFKYPD